MAVGVKSGEVKVFAVNEETVDMIIDLKVCWAIVTVDTQYYSYTLINVHVHSTIGTISSNFHGIFRRQQALGCWISKWTATVVERYVRTIIKPDYFCSDYHCRILCPISEDRASIASSDRKRRQKPSALNFPKTSEIFPKMMLCSKPLLPGSKMLEFDSKGKEYQSPDDGYKLVIPKGAISEGKSASIQHGVVGYVGQFQFPEGFRPYSPIVWLCSTENEFLKPIEVTLQHCAVCKTEEDRKALVILKAKHNIPMSGEEVFHFEPTDGRVSFTSNPWEATLETDHLCFYCLGIYNKNDTEMANYCLTRIMPHNTDPKGFEIHFCLSYYLDTCKKVSCID